MALQSELGKATRSVDCFQSSVDNFLKFNIFFTEIFDQQIEISIKVLPYPKFCELSKLQSVVHRFK